MLYSIIPPVLVVVSLAGIIFFLVKKASKVEALALAETEQESGLAPTVKLGRKFVDAEKTGRFFLAILEKITSKSRIVFLKLETKFSAWSSAIRNKRMNGVAARRAQECSTAELKTEESEIIRKLKEYDLKEKKYEIKKEVKSNFEKEVRPMVSERMVSPKKVEIRNRVEELLIERIAVNPKDIEAYERLGEYYFEIKSLNDSKECFKQVIKLDPKNRNAKYRMRRLETLLAKR